MLLSRITVSFNVAGCGSLANSNLDSFLHSILTMLPKGEVTLVYTSSPPTEVKPRKDQTIIRKGSEDVLRAVKRQEQPTNNSTQPGDNILANYVLFNQGVFLGYIGMFFFVVILYFGLSAITSLKITLGGKLSWSHGLQKVWFANK